MTPMKKLKQWVFPDRRARPVGVDISHQTILYLEGITVSFDGFRALNDLTLYINAGELRCIIGPNGAGKTTMMDVITGKTRPDTGTAYFGQTIDLLAMTEPEIAQAGIGRKFQKPTVFEQHSVQENLELAMADVKSVWHTLHARLTAMQQERIDEVLEIIRQGSAQSTRWCIVTRTKTMAGNRHAVDAGTAIAIGGRTRCRHDATRN